MLLWNPWFGVFFLSLTNNSIFFLNISRSNPTTVLIGAHSLTKDKYAVRVKIQSVHIPETFSTDTKVDDIMLLKVRHFRARYGLPKRMHKGFRLKNDAFFQLQHKVQIKKNKVDVKKIPEPGKDIPAGTKCEVRGWGVTSPEHKKPSDILREVEVTVVDRKLCSCYYNNKPKITDDMLCAGNEQGHKDACTVGRYTIRGASNIDLNVRTEKVAVQLVTYGGTKHDIQYFTIS